MTEGMTKPITRILVVVLVKSDPSGTTLLRPRPITTLPLDKGTQKHASVEPPWVDPV